MKLTKAQRDFLARIAVSPKPADPTYRPALALVKLGYANRDRHRGKVMFYWLFTITDLGRAALAEGGETR